MKTKKGESRWDYIVENLEFIKDYLANKVATKDELKLVKDNLDGFKTEVRQEFASIRNVMVTKDYLDIKLADLRGDLVLLTRKEDTKVKHLVNILKNKKVITKNEAEQVFRMEPFAQV